MNRRHFMMSTSGAIVASVLPDFAMAACPSADALTGYIEDFKAMRPSKGIPIETMEDAYCMQAELVKRLPEALGKKVGFKAAFTNPAMYERFKVTGPAYGYMFEKMMLQSGAHVPANFGARPLFEADLLVELRSPGLYLAKTPLDALIHLWDLIPFIELPDLMLEDKNIGGAQLVAHNVAFRGGVMGPRIRCRATNTFLDEIASMQVIMTEDKSGKELGRAPGSTLMGHPFNAAIWLAKALDGAGIELQKGDLFSLGGFLPPMQPQPNTTITVKYEGMLEDPSVTVHFD
jgi:2-keto-4-pentenoate hydratase